MSPSLYAYAEFYLKIRLISHQKLETSCNRALRLHHNPDLAKAFEKKGKSKELIHTRESSRGKSEFDFLDCIRAEAFR